MKIVINIPEELYKKISLNNPPYGEDFPLYYAVRNCEKLPKGHGRLIDADDLRCENADFDTYNDYCTMFDEIDNAQTIVEADKEGGSRMMRDEIAKFKEITGEKGWTPMGEICRFLDGYERGCDKTADRVLEALDKEIGIYSQLGKPDNQHRDVIIALTNFRKLIVRLKEGAQE